jgi:phospholipase C
VRRSTSFLSLFLLAGLAWIFIQLAACGSPSTQQTIQYVVLIVQENRTPDGLFHGLPNADIANSGVNSHGQTITLTPVSLTGEYDPDHSHQSFLKMYDGGKMDGADKIPIACSQQEEAACNPPPPNPQFRYVEPSQVQPYFDMAEQYTFGDRMFQTNQGPSFPAHQFVISGTSAPTATSDLFAASNPGGISPAGTDAGCTAPPGEIVSMIDPAGNYSDAYPCFEHLTLLDLLDNAGINWRYYTPSAGSIWTGPNAIRHLRFGPDWAKGVVLQPTQIFSDISAGKLPAVTWVIPGGQESDHAGGNEGLGPSWVASIVNAIGNSGYWAHTAIIITWDDWGGWYDHVAPKIYNQYEYGFRVPLIVVSPYAKAAYISHVTHDFGSILKFIEVNYKLPSLGYADARADDLSDCFDYSQKPLKFQTIPAPQNATYFIEDKSPAKDPDDD